MTLPHSSRSSRRQFLGGVVLLPAAVLVASATARAETPKVDPASDPIAKSLNYVHDATASKRPSPDQLCANCVQYTGEPGAEWGPCKIFPGKLVSAKGWCSAWVKKT